MSIEIIIGLIGMIAGLGIVLWLFTKDAGQCKVDEALLIGYIDTAKREDLVDYKEITPLEPLPDEILERYVMHRNRY